MGQNPDHRSMAAIRVIVEKSVSSLSDGGGLVFTAVLSSHS